MLNWIIDFSLRHRFLVIAVALTFAAIGAVSLGHLDIDAFPDTTAGADSDQYSCPRALA